MEASSASLSHWDYLMLLIFRPALAISFVVLFISFGWCLAWKLVLVHIPLVQEIFGLRKKPVKPKPVTGRLSRYYNSMNARNSASPGVGEETKG
ncbi:uncharacterized protein [Euphorbia lathyris]|uniref:uncharacterized protein n=1 Tax=Euphorbia lathyris TaxID=212925 RepID=UPI0033143856